MVKFSKNFADNGLNGLLEYYATNIANGCAHDIRYKILKLNDGISTNFFNGQNSELVDKK